MKTMKFTAISVLALVLASIGLASCGRDDDADTSTTAAGSDLPQGSEPANLDPADFTTKIDNPYWPMTPGSRWVYRETDTAGTNQKVVVRVTPKTKRIANGVEAVVVRDTVTDNGQPVEVTDDWYAQDSDGNLWYLGENTAEYEKAKVATRAGSFEAGVDGAEAGIIMPADPQPGMEYREEYYAGEAEDSAAIVAVGDDQVQVPAGHYDGLVVTRNLSPLEPKVEEMKFYARGVGPVLEAGISGGAPGYAELVSYTPGA